MVLELYSSFFQEVVSITEYRLRQFLRFQGIKHSLFAHSGDSYIRRERRQRDTSEKYRPQVESRFVRFLENWSRSPGPRRCFENRRQWRWRCSGGGSCPTSARCNRKSIKQQLVSIFSFRRARRPHTPSMKASRSLSELRLHSQKLGIYFSLRPQRSLRPQTGKFE